MTGTSVISSGWVRLTAVLCGVAVVFSSGCNQIAGYRNDSLFPTDVQTVCLEMFENQTFWRGVEYELTDALAKRIEAETPYKIVSDKERADTVLSGRIVSINQYVLTAERELGGVLEKELELRIVVTWKNLKNGKFLLQDEPVTAATSYSTYQSQDFRYASSVAANTAARKIVELMELQW